MFSETPDLHPGLVNQTSPVREGGVSDRTK